MLIKLRTDGNFWTGTNAERLASFSAPYLEGLTFYETDTLQTFYILGQTWVQNNAGAVIKPQRTIVASDTVALSDYTILADSSLAAITVTLGVLAAGRIVVIKNIDNTLGVIVDPSANLIDNAGGTVALVLNQTLRLQSDGTNFWEV